MYYFIGCLLVIIVVFFVFFHHRKKIICKKLNCMSMDEKCEVLSSFIEPFGYCYHPSQDIFSTTVDAPQRVFGYTALFDRYASQFNMAIDCMPVYFDYEERTWLIEFWKGQYGINVGCEVGIYKAEGLVSSLGRKTALFHSVEDHEMMPMSIRLFHRNKEIAHLHKNHWWLTAFQMGRYCEPKELWVEAGITFPNFEMLHAFVNALEEQGHGEYCICGLQIQIRFDYCSTCYLRGLHKFFFRFCQWRNRILCRLFLWVTKPFCLGIDQVLCLFYYLPAMFRRIFRDKKRKKCCRKCCKLCRRKHKKNCCGKM
ncbi:MAG: DUF4474 domain-containing protein [Lachnospiraceae bacterium]|nr:DUF4474 domain-containing protein [Lachnospiraceae bacterium]